MRTPRTSIIMPVYNTANTVINAIQSVRNQTDPNFELLIMIDGSPDNSADIITDYHKKNPDTRIHIFNNPKNKGVSAVRNQGLDAARGDWITFIDSDDEYHPEFLEKLHEAARTHDADIAVCGHTIRHSDGTEVHRVKVTPGVHEGEDIAIEFLEDRYTGFMCDKIFRVQLFDGVRFAEDIHRAEDALVVFACCMKAKRLVGITDHLYTYRMEQGGLTWGRITPVEESIRHTNYMRRVAGDLLKTPRGKNAFAASTSVTFLNNAQQALLAGGSDAPGVIAACRKQLSWGQVFATLRSRPLMGAAGALLKLSPKLYRVLYGAYVKRNYGL